MPSSSKPRHGHRINCNDDSCYCYHFPKDPGCSLKYCFDNPLDPLCRCELYPSSHPDCAPTYCEVYSDNIECICFQNPEDEFCFPFICDTEPDHEKCYCYNEGYDDPSCKCELYGEESLECQCYYDESYSPDCPCLLDYNKCDHGNPCDLYGFDDPECICYLEPFGDECNCFNDPESCPPTGSCFVDGDYELYFDGVVTEGGEGSLGPIYAHIANSEALGVGTMTLCRKEFRKAGLDAALGLDEGNGQLIVTDINAVDSKPMTGQLDGGFLNGNMHCSGDILELGWVGADKSYLITGYRSFEFLKPNSGCPQKGGKKSPQAAEVEFSAPRGRGSHQQGRYMQQQQEKPKEKEETRRRRYLKQ